jgi:hypothetical protein
MSYSNDEKRVLALDVRPRSFGFAVFEGPNQLLDWGARSFRSGVNAVKIPAAKKLLALLDEFTPSAIVVRERPTGRTTRRTKMLAMIRKQAASRRTPVRLISREVVNRAFVGFESNRYQVASALAQKFPALASRLPSKRKCWQSEGYGMSIFDAAALGVSYFTQEKSGSKSAPRQRFSTVLLRQPTGGHTNSQSVSQCDN